MVGDEKGLLDGGDQHVEADVPLALQGPEGCDVDVHQSFSASAGPDAPSSVSAESEPEGCDSSPPWSPGAWGRLNSTWTAPERTLATGTVSRWAGCLRIAGVSTVTSSW